ncbi:MAG TPA: 50S ribosomal protein L29 [Elusimicrobia bacterium]|nr:50S ribosomal protein L29 [Elusimicrobiota bacterium]
MKNKEKETKKNLSAQELKAELHRLKEKRFKLRLKHKVTPLTNAMELQSLRRDIARMMTWIRQKELQAAAK